MFIRTSSSRPTAIYICFLWLAVCLYLLRLCESKTDKKLNIIRDFKFVSDAFLLPNSMCLNTNHDPCPSYGATRNKSYAGCLCFCPTSKATFYETQRQCIGNQRARTQGGSCKYHFIDENPQEELKILSLFTPRNIESPQGKECKIDLLDRIGNKYLNCNGMWENIPIKELGEKFKVTWKWSSKLSLKLKYDENGTVHPQLNGRLIRLDMKCRQAETSGPVVKSCLLLKVHGTATCPLFIQKPTPVDTTTYQFSTFEISTYLTTEPNFRVSSSEATPSTPAIRTLITDKATEQDATRNVSNIKKVELENQTPHGAIAGVVGGVGGGLVLILMIAFLACHWTKIRIAGTVVRSDDVDGHEMYTAPSVSTLQRERARTLSRDSGKYTETWYEEVPDDKAEKEKRESLYQEISPSAQETLVINSELYDDVIATDSNDSKKFSQNPYEKPNLLEDPKNPMEKGFFNPGFQEDPGHDGKREGSQTQVRLGFPEVNTKEMQEGETTHLSQTADTDYVSMATNNICFVDNDKRYVSVLDPNYINYRNGNTNLETFDAKQTCTEPKPCEDESRKSDEKSCNDNTVHSNAAVFKEGQEASKQSFTVQTPLGEAHEYDNPTLPMTSQPSPENSPFTQYEQMGEQTNDVDEAGYSVASDLFSTTLSTKL